MITDSEINRAILLSREAQEIMEGLSSDVKKIHRRTTKSVNHRNIDEEVELFITSVVNNNQQFVNKFLPILDQLSQSIKGFNPLLLLPTEIKGIYKLADHRSNIIEERDDESTQGDIIDQLAGLNDKIVTQLNSDDFNIKIKLNAIEKLLISELSSNNY